MKFGLANILFYSGFSQIPEDSYCIGESIETTAGFEDYSWDYCGGELEVEPVSNSVSSIGISRANEIKVVYDTINATYYAFFADFGSASNDSFWRLNFGNSLSNDPDVSEITVPGIGLVDPDGFDLAKQGDNWFGFVGSVQSGYGITRLDFGSSLENTPTATNIGSFDLTGRIRGLKIVENQYLVALGYNPSRLQIVEYQNGFANDFTAKYLTSSYPQLINSAGLTFIKVNGDWVSFLVSINTSQIVRLNFGNDILTEPAVEAIYDFGLTQMYKVRIVERNENNYLFITTFNSGVRRVKMQNLPLSISPEIDDVTSSQSYSFDIAYDQGTFVGLSFQGSSLIETVFDSECDASISYSDNFQSFSYSSQGEKIVSAISNDGVFIDDTITISSSLAPLVGISFDDNRCISSTNTFTPSIAGLTSYSWDFNGDGIEDSNEESPSYQFPLVGRYTVRLDVSDGSCDNFSEQEITIYPDPPVPTFAVTSASTFCTNNELTLANTTDETGYGDMLTYQWVINGDITNQADTVYTFTTAGVKTITLQSFLPGCSSAVASQEVMIDEGPEVSFNYTNNCFGKAIQFTSEVKGSNITEFSWDFGDGSSTSAEESPLHTYSTAGDFIVILSVMNSSGCETTHLEELIVNEDSLVKVDIGESIENLPIPFKGIDLTSRFDSIVSWNWNFYEFGSIEGQNPTITVSTPGSYNYDLEIVTEQGCSESFSDVFIVIKSSNPTVSFEIAQESCVGENIEIGNNTVNGTSYEWDFCGLEFENTPNEQALGSIEDVSRVNALELVYDSINSSYYLIFIDFNSNDLEIYELGDSLGTTYSLVNKVSIGSELTLSDGLDIIQDQNGEWYGYAGSADSNTGLTRIDFGSSFDQSISVTNLGTFGFNGNLFRDVRVLKDQGSFYVVALDYTSNRLLILDYDHSLMGEPIDTVLTSSINTLSNAGGFDIIKIEKTWYSFITSINGADIVRLNFGPNLKSEPVIEADYELVDLNSPYKIELSYSDGHIYALVGNFDGGVTVLDLGVENEIQQDIKNLSYSLSQSFSVVGAYYKGDYYFYTLTGGQLNRIRFSGVCGETVGYSTDDSPTISYKQSDSIVVTLTAYNDDLKSSSLTDTIFINDLVAPTILITSDDSRCITTPTTFTPTISGLTSYSWDFNNDGVEDSSEESPTFDYSSLGAGTYTVRLDVSDGSCDNFIEEEITIYEAPPVPTLEVSATALCINTAIDFNNTTVDDTYEGPLVYQWEFIDDATAAVVGTSDQREASFSFATTGEKTVRLTSSIPGCEEVTEQKITVLEGPPVSFTAPSVCELEAMPFTNTSEDVVSYLWDFGDGFTSTVESPDHVYTTAGNYNVSLTGTNAAGCSTTTIVEVAVSDLPQANFDFDIPCNSASGVPFMDLSTVSNADVVDWQWFVAGELVSEEQNPTLNFSEYGLVDVSLAVTSSNGCESTFQEEIEIFETPNPDFTSTIGCLGEESIFEDATAFPAGTITAWLWFIDGESFSTQDANYTFNSPGIYEVTLEVIGQNFCSESITQSIEVLALPTVDFSIKGDCDNVLVQAQDQSIASADLIISRTWLLDGAVVGNGSELLLSTLPSNTYELMLEVGTDAGCTTSDVSILEINASPSSSFSSSRTFGLPGDVLTFNNTSTGAVDYRWLVDGVAFSNATANETVTFPEPGDYVVQLIANNSLGCSDTTSQEILVAIPEVDLSIGSFDLLNENGTGKILLEIVNQSNLPVESVVIDIVLENQFAVKEQVDQLIGIGSSASVSLNVGIPIGLSEPAYFCVSLTSPYEGYTDVNPLDNEKCFTIDPEVKVEDPFPNPVTDEVRLKVISPIEGLARISLINSAGKIQTDLSYEVEQGLNNFIIDMSVLDPGVYYITIDIGGTIFQKKIIKL